MAKYECRTVPLSSLIIGPRGVVIPLCNTCASADCENNIQWKTLSIFGRNQKFKVIEKNMLGPQAVIQCLGYVQKGT